MKPLSFWIKAARPTALPQSVTAAILAISMAFGHEGFSWWLSLVALFGIICGHLGMNIADDYFDWKNGDVDRRGKAVKGMRVMTSKCVYFDEVGLKQVFTAMCCYLAIALCCGLVVLWQRGSDILWYILAAGVLGLGYSFPGLRLSYHGLGELVIGIMFGPLLVCGMTTAACGEVSSGTILMGIAAGMLSMNIVYVHAVLDMPCDRSIGKTTFAQLLKGRTAILITLAILSFGPVLVVLTGNVLGLFESLKGWFYILTAITLAPAAKLVKSVSDFLAERDSDLTPSILTGPMENWEGIKSGSVDWFMFRWYLARNICSTFCIIVTLINLIFLFF